MAIICKTYLSTRDFSYHADSECFVAEDSTLTKGHTVRSFSRVYDDACDEGFVLVSHVTGDSIVFALESIKRDREGDIQSWEFKAVARQCPNGFRNCKLPYTATIFND